MIAFSKNIDVKKMAIVGAAALAVAAIIAPEQIMAGTGGSEFTSVWTTLTDWMEGTLGKIGAGAMILVGIISGITRGSIMAFATGIGAGIGLYSTPAILDKVLSATLENAPAVTDGAIAISNGLGM